MNGAEFPFWSHPDKEVFDHVAGSPNGLSCDEASRRLKTYGPNSVKDDATVSALTLLLGQFKSPITLLLIATAILSYLLGDTTNAIIILFITLVSAALGWWQEKGALSTMRKLATIVQTNCRVLRQGEEHNIHIEEAVPGDITILSAGDVVPGDGLLIEENSLFVDEAAFTGETYPVEKAIGVLHSDLPISKRVNSLFMGSHIVSGRGKMVIVETGKHTQFGKIADRLRTKAPETNFEHGIRKFGYLLMEVTLILVVIIFAVNVFLDKPIIESLLFSLALAVGLTPQLLPAIISVNLAKGAKKMASEKVIVKKLSSIENLGSMNILCSDKTGTITEGKVVMKSAVNSDGRESEKVLHYAWLNAFFQQGFSNPIDKAIVQHRDFDKTEFHAYGEIPYDFIRKRLTVIVANDQSFIAITKGALSKVADVCSYIENSDGTILPITDRRADINQYFNELSSNGYRVLGLAYKRLTGQRYSKTDESEMIFLGFISFTDPVKQNVASTIDSLKQLGVDLKIVTGDNAQVSRKLAVDLGIELPVVVTGQQVQMMSDNALMNQARKVHVFAEVEPNQKEKIILALKRSGNIVGFMGDGINDTTAMHAADVSISVDSAVDVARAAADIILLERDLGVLKGGIVAGRKTFGNTLKYIFMATSANFGNMISMALSSLFLPFLPLLPKQILLTNLLTDLPEMTIASDKIDEEMITRPHKWDLDFIKHFMITFGLLSSVFDVVTFYVLLKLLHANMSAFQTGWFIESVVSASLVVLIVRTRKFFIKSPPGRPLLAMTTLVILFVIIIPFTPMATWFGFVNLPLRFFSFLLPIIVTYVIATEFIKAWFYKRWTMRTSSG